MQSSLGGFGFVRVGEARSLGDSLDRESSELANNFYTRLKESKCMLKSCMPSWGKGAQLQTSASLRPRFHILVGDFLMLYLR